MGRAFEFRKARKMKRWSAMSKAFTRIGKDIVIAVKEGGPDPDSNSKLRAVIQNAKSVNMPKDNIERAIKKASEKSTENFKELLLEGYAPHGVAILIEAATDNNNRTVANIRSYFNKFDGSLATSGSVDFLFVVTPFLGGYFRNPIATYKTFIPLSFSKLLLSSLIVLHDKLTSDRIRLSIRMSLQIIRFSLFREKKYTKFLDLI